MSREGVKVSLILSAGRPAGLGPPKRETAENVGEAPPSPFHWAAELGEGLFGRFKQPKADQSGNGGSGGSFLKSLF